MTIDGRTFWGWGSAEVCAAQSESDKLLVECIPSEGGRRSYLTGDIAGRAAIAGALVHGEVDDWETPSGRSGRFSFLNVAFTFPKNVLLVSPADEVRVLINC